MSWVTNVMISVNHWDRSTAGEFAPEGREWEGPYIGASRKVPTRCGRGQKCTSAVRGWLMLMDHREVTMPPPYKDDDGFWSD